MKLPIGVRTVITGAGSGFGRALALELARRNARVLCADINLEGAEETARMVRDRGGEAEAMKVDVRDAEQVESMAVLADDKWGGTDFLINNAGVAVAGEVGKISLEDWRWQLDINLNGVIYGCHAFIPRMRKQRRGWILNVASLAGFASLPLMAPYNTTKAAVIALSETLMTEVADDNIQVTVACPGFFRTNIHKNTRAPNEAVVEQSAKMVNSSFFSAESVARTAIRGVDSGTLYVLPQPEAHLLWRVKRLLGAQFFTLTRMAVRMGVIERLSRD